VTTESAISTHVDPGVLASLQEIMEDNYSVLLDTFLQDSDHRLDELKKAGADAVGRERVSKAAHSFKGSSSNMGALKLADLCSQLEQCANKAPDNCDIDPLIQKIVAEFELVKPIYEQERSGRLSA